MQQHRVTTFTIDGIIRGTNLPPAILEFNRGIDSGDIGYRAIYGYSIMDKIIPDLKRKTGVDYIWFDRDYRHWHFPPTSEDPYDPAPMVYYEDEDGWPAPKTGIAPALFETGKSHLLFPRSSLALDFPPASLRNHPNDKAGIYIVKPIDLKAVRNYRTLTGNAHISIADSMNGLSDLYNDKGILSTLIKQGKTDPAFFPDQEEYTLEKDGDLAPHAETIAARFKGVSGLVLKHPLFFAGQSMQTIHDPSSEKDVLEALERYRSSLPDIIQNGNMNEEAPRLIVQEMIHPEPLSVRRSFTQASIPYPLEYNILNVINDRVKRNHAFRLFMSYIDGEVMLHDGWIKFSNHASSSKDEQRHRNGTKFAGPLPAKEKERLASTLKPVLENIFKTLENESTPSSFDIGAPS